jgi:hypothetical protein
MMLSFKCANGVFFVDYGQILYAYPVSETEIFMVFKNDNISVSIEFDDKEQKEEAEKMLTF